MAREPAPPVDPEVRIPRAVREASERAAAAQTASIGTAEPPVIPDPNAPPAPPQDPPPAVPPQPVVPPAAEPPSPPQPSPAPPQAPTAPAEPINWEERYKTLNGRYEADRKRHREALNDMTGRITQLERQLTSAAPAPAAAPPKLNLTPDELADYGEDFVGMVKRIAEGVVDGKVQPLTTEIGRTRAQVAGAQNKSMHEQMNTLFPDWAQLNGDERFIEWVLLPDPYSGAIRQGLMQEAWDAGDARRVNAFFQGFLAEEAATNPAGTRVPPVAPAPAAPPAPAATPPLSLTALAAPGGARSAPAGTPAEKPTYTTEDITRFYTEVAAGKWRARDQERAAIDADIMRAQHEGRIIQNRRFAAPQAPNGFAR